MKSLRFTEAQLKEMIDKRHPRFVQPLPPVGEAEITKNKFGAIPTEVDGIRFASRREARRWITLDAMQGMGKITKLRHHVRFALEVNTIPLGEYEGDFVYTDETGMLIIEDAKGMKSGAAYRLFQLKAKLMTALYGAIVKEV